MLIANKATEVCFIEARRSKLDIILVNVTFLFIYERRNKYSYTSNIIDIVKCLHLPTSQTCDHYIYQNNHLLNRQHNIQTTCESDILEEILNFH